jgi:orotate phosphoribosyltransferase
VAPARGRPAEGSGESTWAGRGRGRRRALSAEPFIATRDLLRAELAGDLSRGGYVLRADDEHTRERRYFDKFLVLSRPGLLARAARLLAEMVGEDCERLAVTGVPSTALGTALAQETGLALLMSDDAQPDTFGGELFAGTRVTLVEDVVFTGRRALGGARALRTAGAELLDVLCLLDRQSGAAQLLAHDGIPLRALFTEAELLQQPGQAPR